MGRSEKYAEKRESFLNMPAKKPAIPSSRYRWLMAIQGMVDTRMIADCLSFMQFCHPYEIWFYSSIFLSKIMTASAKTIAAVAAMVRAYAYSILPERSARRAPSNMAVVGRELMNGRIAAG